MKTYVGYDHVHLSPDEACIYIGIKRSQLRDWCRKYRTAYGDLTPYVIDRCMGWREQFVHKHQPARTPHPDILTVYPVATPPPAPLDSDRPSGFTIHGYTPAQPFGTSSGSISTEYRKPSRRPHAAPQGTRSRSQSSATRQPQSRRQAQGHQEQGGR